MRMSLLQSIDPQLLAPVQSDSRYDHSPFRNLRLLAPKQKGERYEKITIALMQQLGHTYLPRTSSQNDAMFDGTVYEIKGSMLGNGIDNFSFLQIRPDQDYQALLFVMFYPQRVIIMSMHKPDILAQVASGVFRPQHRGQQGNTGTYLYQGNEKTLITIGAQLLHEIE
jgi:hypothetical protein